MDKCDVLVVDDDEAVRTVTSEMLVRLGFTVAQADGGERALQEVAHREFQVVLLDLAMPAMSGTEVYALMRERGVGARVIFMTGYSPAECRGLLGGDLDVAVLSKPFPMRELQNCVESALVGLT